MPFVKWARGPFPGYAWTMSGGRWADITKIMASLIGLDLVQPYIEINLWISKLFMDPLNKYIISQGKKNHVDVSEETGTWCPSFSCFTVVFVPP